MGVNNGCNGAGGGWCSGGIPPDNVLNWLVIQTRLHSASLLASTAEHHTSHSWLYSGQTRDRWHPSHHQISSDRNQLEQREAEGFPAVIFTKFCYFYQNIKIDVNPGVGKIKETEGKNQMFPFISCHWEQTGKFCYYWDHWDQSDLEPFNCHFWNSTLFGGQDRQEHKGNCTM